MSVAASVSCSSVAAVLATEIPLRLHPGVSLSTDFVQPFPDLDTAFDPCDEDPHALVLIACAIFESTGCVALCRVSPNKYVGFKVCRVVFVQPSVPTCLPFNCFHRFAVDSVVHRLRNFLLAVKQCYRGNPYHGWQHGVHVLLNCYKLLRYVA
jgi:hypothetical protein